MVENNNNYNRCRKDIFSIGDFGDGYSDCNDLPTIDPNDYDKDGFFITTETVRTYKTGIRELESFLWEHNELVIEREVLQENKRVIKKNNNKSFSIKFTNIKNATVFQKYKHAVEKYRHFNTIQEIDFELGLNQSKLNELHRSKSDITDCNSFKPALPIDSLKHKVFDIISNKPNVTLKTLIRLFPKARDRTLSAYMNEFSKSIKYLPSFTDISNPLPSEISLHDYKFLRNRSFNLICRHLNTVIQQTVDSPTQDYFFDRCVSSKEIAELAFNLSRQNNKQTSQRDLDTKLEKAIAEISSSHAPLSKIAFSQLANSLKAYFTLRKKVGNVSELFVKKKISNTQQTTETDFSDAVSCLLAYYSIPNHLRTYLKQKWKVDFNWVGSTLRGWRRRLDPLLPSQFQIEPLTNLFLELAKYYHKFARTNDDIKDIDDIKVISIFQRKHVLHLLPNRKINLSTLLPTELRENYSHLRNNVKNLPDQLQNDLDIKVEKISTELFSYSLEDLLLEVIEKRSMFDPNSQTYKNRTGFINKLNLIKEKVNLPEFKVILNNFIIGNRFTHSIVQLFRTPRIKNLFTAFRGVFSLALAHIYPDAIDNFKEIFDPDNCLTRPFKSQNRKKTQLPVNLLANDKNVLRKDHPTSHYFLPNRYDPRRSNNQIDTKKINTTEIFRRGEPIWLGFPIYSPDQMINDKIKGNRKGTFWFQLIPSKKIIECVKAGAEVRDINLSVPQKPSGKIIAYVSLAAENCKTFIHAGNFCKDWDRENLDLSIPTHDFLGVDFNKIDQYMIAVANPDKEIDILPMMNEYWNAFRKLEWYRRVEIPNIQKRLKSNKDKNKNPLTSALRRRLKTQIALLHKKRMQIMVEMKRRALMIYLFIAYKSNARHLSWDSIEGISTKGKRGALATAITYLPKRKALFDLINEWAEDLRDQGYLPAFNSIVPVSSFTSQVCGDCFKGTSEMSRTRKKGIPYDEFYCTRCGKQSNRHSNSAQVSAILLQKEIIKKKLDISINNKINNN